MLGAMFIGLSGMTAYSNGLRQISNNITNLNSSGFRASSVGFNDLFRSGSNGISYSGGQSGGGGGVQLSELRLDFSQGELRQTGRDLDLAVDGSGFLVLEKDGEYFYARTGSFEVDTDGFIVLAGTDYKLTVLDEAGRAVSLSIDDYRTNPPQATTTIKFFDNLSSTATSYTIPNIQVYNKNGEADTWEVLFTRKTATPRLSISEVLDPPKPSPDDPPTDPPSFIEWTVTVTNKAGDVIRKKTLKFTTDGQVDPTTSTLTFNDSEGRRIKLDFSENVTSFSSGEISTLRTSSVDGFGSGEITRLNVNDAGVLEIGYSNEQTTELGAIALADFRDPQSLEQRSGGLFVYEGASGRELFSSESNRVGKALSSRIEASNVDLSQQFGDLILVQRGYQASSQIVSVSNDMIQQLFGIRGQG